MESKMTRSCNLDVLLLLLLSSQSDAVYGDGESDEKESSQHSNFDASDDLVAKVHLSTCYKN